MSRGFGDLDRLPDPIRRLIRVALQPQRPCQGDDRTVVRIVSEQDRALLRLQNYLGYGFELGPRAT
jgi:hypothetical protein